MLKKILVLIIACVTFSMVCMEENVKKFFEAVQEGDLNNIKSLIGKVGVNIQDAKGNTPLMVAVDANKPQIVEFLIGQGADVNQINENPDDLYKDTALNIAIYSKNLEMVKLLIQKGANVNQQAKHEYSPSMYRIDIPLINAIENSTPEIVEYLLQKGANPNVSDDGGLTPLYYASENSDLEKIRLLVKYGAKVNYKIHLPKHAGANDMTVFMWAAIKGKVAVVQELIKLGADPLLEDSEGYDAYILATDVDMRTGNKKLSEKLRKITNILRSIELSKAIRMGELERVESLLKGIYDVNQLSISDAKTAHDLAQDKEKYKKIMNLLEAREKEIKQILSSIEQSLIQAIRNFTKTLQVLQIAINKE